MGLLDDFISTKTGVHVKPKDALSALVRNLERALLDFEGRVAELHPSGVRFHEKVLRKGKKLLSNVLARMENPSEESY